MSDRDIFLIEVARRGNDGIGTPIDYATMRADIIALQAQPVINELDDIADVDTTGVADGDILIYDADTSSWIVDAPQTLPIQVASGDPNGVITGDTGDLYLQTVPNGGRQLWVKVSGSGDTFGWLPSERAGRRRTRREVFVYQGASASGSFVTVGFQNGPTPTANAYANADAATGAFLQLNTSGVLNNVASLVAGSNSGVRLDWRPDISFGIRTPPTITDLRQWYGLFASSPAASDGPAIEGFGFRYSNGSDTTYQTWSNDGSGSGVTTDTGIVVNGNTANDLRAVVNDAFNAIDFFVDGNWVARHTTDLPASSTVLNYGIYCTTLTAAARALRWSRITLETRP